MTQELSLLVWSVLLTMAQVVVIIVGAVIQVDLRTLAGNRETRVVLSGWAGRAQRAHVNMLENLPLFATLVLAAQVSNRLDGVTRLGAQTFFWARLAYVIIYIAGISWLRSLVFAISVVGMLLILSQLL